MKDETNKQKTVISPTVISAMRRRLHVYIASNSSHVVFLGKAEYM